METAKMECAKYGQFLQTLEKKVVFQVNNVCFYLRIEKLGLSTIRKPVQNHTSGFWPFLENYDEKECILAL